MSSKFLLISFLLILGSCLLGVALASPVKGQVPEPYKDCSQKDIDEWHSLRPYQASPCELPLLKEEQAILCGSDLVVQDVFMGDPKYITSCQDCSYPGGCCLEPGIHVCQFSNQPRNFSIETDAYESELPIAGNTELVKGDDPTWTMKNLSI